MEGITDAKALRAHQLELLVESVVDYAIFVLDPDGVVLSWNAGAERLKGYTAAEIVGRSFRTFYPPSDVEAGRPDGLLATALVEGRAEDEGWRVRKDGTRFWANVVITAIREPDGRLVGFGKVTRDLTERVLAERALRDANQHKDQFLSILSHELRTPLNAVMGFASILEDGVLGALAPKHKAYVGKILDASERLLALIDDLLDLTRIRAGKFTLSPGACDVGAIVREAAEAFEPTAAQRGLQVDVDVSEGLPVIHGDAGRIGQVVSNLVGNAGKFTPEGGQVAIRVRPARAGVRIEVADDGPGIAPEHRQRVFEPFFQVDVSNTRRAGGTGLGLGIARALVEAHGGAIGVESELGRGSTFWVELPRSGPSARSEG